MMPLRGADRVPPIVFVLAFLLPLVFAGPATRPAVAGGAAVHGAAEAGDGRVPLERVLRADGTLDLSGSFAGGLDPSGWKLTIGEGGAPRFERAGGVYPSAGPAPRAAVQADDYWDPRFSIPAVNGVVYALAVTGTNVYVGGSFSDIGTISANNVARWDGSAWSALGADAGPTGNGVNGGVRALVVNGANIYAGGGFTTTYSSDASSVSANRVARWDGSAWSALGSGSGPTGNGVNGTVFALAAIGSNVVAGGVFTAAFNSLATSVSANHIAEWVDSGIGSHWIALGSNSGPTGNGVNGSVFAIAVPTNTLAIYAGGGFTTAYNSNASSVSANNVAGFSLGGWFALGSDSGATGNGVNDSVRALAFLGPNLIAGGEFITAHNSLAAPKSANHIAEWTGSGWLALGVDSGPTGNGVDDTVNVIAVPTNIQAIYVGGSFSTAYTSNTISVSSNHIAGFSIFGWFSFGGGSGPTANGVSEEEVEALAVSGGDVYVGGDFTTAYAGGVPVSVNQLARWNGSAWSALSAGTGGYGVSGVVHALAMSGSSLYVGGSFDTVFNNGTPLSANNVAFWNGSSWSALGTGSGPTGNGVNGTVFALAVSGGDLYVGGTLTNAYSGVAAPAVNHIARWNGSAWSRLGSDASTSGNGVNGRVYALAAGGGSLYVGGQFDTAYTSNASSVSANNVARWNGSSWAALGANSGPFGNGLSAQVNALALSGSNLYAGGDFNFAYTSAATMVSANSVARWNGSAWSRLGGTDGFTGNGVNGFVQALAVNGSDLYVGGFFNTAYTNGTTTVSANGVARWNGSTWSPLGSGGGPTGNGLGGGYANAFAVLGSTVYVAGSFANAYNGGSAVPASNVARWDGNGWSPLGSGTDRSDAALAISPAGEIYVGGNFIHAGAKPSNGIGRFYTPTISVDDVTVAEGNAGITPATFTLRLTAPSPLTFTVDFATADGSATAPADYGALAASVTVPFLATSVPITINVVGDTAPEPDETFYLNLTAASAGVIVDAQGIGTITNDDTSTPTTTATATPPNTPTPEGVTPRAFLPFLRR